VIELSVRCLRFPKRRFSYEGMSEVLVIIRNTLLITMALVNAYIFIFLNFRNASRGKRDGEREGRGCASLSFISSQLSGYTELSLLL